MHRRAPHILITFFVAVIMAHSAGVNAAPIFALTQESNTATLGAVTDVATVGYEFVTGSQPLTVTGLGTWDGAPNGLAASHQVGIWTNTGTLLGSVTVIAGGATLKVGSWRYEDLTTPIVLAASTHYRIGTQVNGDVYHASIFDDTPPNNDHIDPDWPVFSTPDVTYVQRWANLASGLNFPNALSDPGNTSSAWDAPNFHTAFAPEPGSAIVLGFAGMMLTRRSAAASKRR